MGQPEQSLIGLGKRVAAMQDRAPEAQLDKERGRARLLAEPLPKASAQRPTRPFAIAIAAALAAAVLSILIVLRPREPLRFDLGIAERGVAGAWIAAPPAAELPIRFSDGSLLRLAPGGRARVVSLSADGADVALERGSLDLSVIHRASTRWAVHVGPFRVNVIGTRFETSWDPVAERFDVAVREGAITVSGPLVGDARPVRAGERIAVTVATSTLEAGRLDAAAIPAPIAPAPAPAPTPIVTATAEPSAPVVMPPPSAPPPRAPRVPASAKGSAAPAPAPVSWRALALDAKYKEALAAAEREGFDALCATAGSSDLHALGDAARLGGSAARAVQALTTLRKRFPGSPEAASAGFLMGRMAQDQSKDFAAAAGWFTRYLNEQPGGAFAADAAGRLVETTDRMGDAAGARRAAERYLAQYPHGSHAAYARGVLARGTDMP